MSRISFPLFALSLLAAGCGGGSYCQEQAKISEDCGYEYTDADIEACEEMLEGCSASDEKKLTKFNDCLMDLLGGACGTETTDMGTDDLFAMLGCVAELDGISETCAATGFETDFDTDFTFSTTYTY